MYTVVSASHTRLKVSLTYFVHDTDTYFCTGVKFSVSHKYARIGHYIIIYIYRSVIISGSHTSPPYIYTFLKIFLKIQLLLHFTFD